MINVDVILNGPLLEISTAVTFYKSSSPRPIFTG